MSSEDEVSARILQQLKQWGSCDVADGLSKALKFKHGGFLDGLTMYSPQFQSGSTKIVGRAFTVKFVPKEDTTAPKLQGNYIDQVPKDAVLFISQPLPHVNAVFGGLMALRAQVLECAGAVVDGRIRDIGEHRELGFPVFARSIGTTAGQMVCRPSEINVPVQLNSADQVKFIEPGDYIIADADGVVVLPAGLAVQVLEAVPAIAKGDQKAATAIRDGMSVEEAFKKFRP